MINSELPAYVWRFVYLYRLFDSESSMPIESVFFSCRWLHGSACMAQPRGLHSTMKAATCETGEQGAWRTGRW